MFFCCPSLYGEKGVVFLGVLEKIFELFCYDKNKNRTNLTRKIEKQFESMRNLNMIKNYKLKYGIFEIEK